MNEFKESLKVPQTKSDNTKSKYIFDSVFPSKEIQDRAFRVLRNDDKHLERDDIER